MGTNWHRLLELLDLRKENTLATWFSSQMFFLTALALSLLGWGDFNISRVSRWLFQLATIGAVLLSADEVGSFHETTGKWFGRILHQFMPGLPADDNGYFWVPLFAPFALLGFILLVYHLHKIILAMSAPFRQQSLFALWGALLCLPTVFIFELLEWRLSISYAGMTILSCFEEMFELLGMFNLYLCTMLIAKNYQL
jgi:hypothetical protein